MRSYQEAIIMSENGATMGGIEDTSGIKFWINEPRAIGISRLNKTAESSVGHIRVPDILPITGNFRILVKEVLSS